MVKLQKSVDKRNALIKATIELVNNNGFHATPMSKIAKMAKVSLQSPGHMRNNKATTDALALLFQVGMV